jgi:hypothetical protein
VRAILDGRGDPLEGAQSRHKPAAFPRGALTTNQPRAGPDASASSDTARRSSSTRSPRPTDDQQYRAIPDAALYVIAHGVHDAIFRAARPDFVRTTLAFLGG